MRKLSWTICMSLLATVATAVHADAQQRDVEEVEIRVVDIDDGQGKKTEQKVERKVRVSVDAGELPSHWIGVMGSPVDGLLKKHLKLDSGVVVEWVSEKSPAEKAGLQVDDIIVSVNGKPVNDIKAVAAQVAKSKDAPLKVVVLRGGDDQRIEVKPEKRPADISAPGAGALGEVELENLHKWIENEKIGESKIPGTVILRLMPGGIVDGDAAKILQGLRKADGEVKGKSISIAITENNGEKKITVTQDGKTTTVNGDNLDELPEDIREHVKKLLDRPKADLSGVIEKVLPGARVEVRKRDAASDNGEERQIRLRQMKRADDEVAKQLKQIQQQLEALRKQVDELREKE